MFKLLHPCVDMCTDIYRNVGFQQLITILWKWNELLSSKKFKSNSKFVTFLYILCYERRGEFFFIDPLHKFRLGRWYASTRFGSFGALGTYCQRQKSNGTIIFLGARAHQGVFVLCVDCPIVNLAVHESSSWQLPFMTDSLNTSYYDGNRTFWKIQVWFIR